MSDTASLTREQPSLVRQAVEWMLAKLVNTHTKRVILLSSLLSRVSRAEKLHDSAIQRLNRMMAIASDERSLAFSSRFENLVWGANPTAELISAEVIASGNMSKMDRWNLAESLVDNAPKCLKYASHTSMTDDIYKLLGSYLDSIRQPAMA